MSAGAYEKSGRGSGTWTHTGKILKTQRGKEGEFEILCQKV
jgi:hypothetical protein